MPASIHPDLELHVVLDEGRFQGDADVELERRFGSAVPTLVERAQSGSERTDSLVFRIAEDEADTSEDTLWRGAVVTWLSDVFDQVSDLVARENDARRQAERPELAFSRLEVRFGTGPAIAVAFDDGRIPVEAAGIVERARDLLADHAFGEDVVRVSVPGCAVGESVASERAAAVDDDTGVAPFAAGGPESAEAEGSPGADDGADPNTTWDSMVGQGSDAGDDVLTGPGFASDERKRDEPTQREIDEAVQEAEDALRGEGGQAQDEGVPSVRTDVGGSDTQPGDDLRPQAYVEGAACTPDLRIWDIDYADGTRLRYDSVLAEVIPVR